MHKDETVVQVAHLPPATPGLQLCIAGLDCGTDMPLRSLASTSYFYSIGSNSAFLIREV